jgi:BirA family biotin operon repressor/biotin-[acetyl-CoA-carboxylase] ligase
MRIIKLSAIGSTNTFLREISSAEPIEDYTVVLAQHQTQGRGQMGTDWLVQDGKNLTFSVFKDVSSISLDDNFYISIVVSISVISVLKELKIPKTYIKWPNDILAGNKKVCGVLIENVIKNNDLSASIIGIGLNVNQTEFDHLPNASSLLRIVGKPFSIEGILDQIIKALQYNFKRLQNNDLVSLKKDYEDQLFRKNKPSTFRDLNDNLFSGYIRGVSNNGKLKVLLEDEMLKEFDLKEIQLLY